MPARPLFFELGYVRGVVKDGWKYIALRYPESARAMAPKRRKTVLDAFNEEQNKKGRPIHNRDPMSPFSHVLQIPGGDPATNTAPTFASDPIFKSDANVGAAYTGSVVPSAATTLALDFTMSPAVTAATDIALAGIVVKVVP